MNNKQLSGACLMGSSILRFLTFSLFLNAQLSFSAILTAADSVVVHTVEGLVSEGTSGASTTNYDLELRAMYARDDIMTFTYSVAFDTESPYSAPSQFSCDGLAANTDKIVFGLLSQNNSQGSLVYRVIETNNGSAAPAFDTVGLHCVTPQVRLSDTELALVSTAAVTVTSQTSAGITMESVTGTVATVQSGFSVTVDQALDATVDVELGSKALVGGAVDNSTDTLRITPSLVGIHSDQLVKVPYSANSTVVDGSLSAMPVTSDLKYTIFGDFSFLDTDLDQLGMQLGTNTVTASNGTVTFAEDLQSLTVDDSDDVLDASTLIITKTAADLELIDQIYEGRLLVYYDSDSLFESISFTAGEWLYNGVKVMVYAVPFSENVTRDLWISNEGSTSYGVTASLHQLGLNFGPYDLGVVSANSVDNVSAILDQQISSSGDIIASGRANVLLKVDGKPAKVVVLGEFSLDSDATPVALKTSAQSLLATP